MAALGIERIADALALAMLSAVQLLGSVGLVLLSPAGVEIQRRYATAALARDTPSMPGPSVP